MGRIIGLAMLLWFGVCSHAAQYQSRELLAPASTQESPKTLEELEKSLATLTNSYSKASTARYLARHFSASDADKAAVYYREALAGDGLSDYAKQDVLAELAQVYLRQKQYAPLLHALAQRRQLGGKDTVVLLLAEALAYCQTQQYRQAVASADAVLAMQKDADAVLLKQLLFVYFNSKAYAKAAIMQERYLELYPDDLAGWRHLAAIYLKLEKKGKAADALSVARQKQLPLAEADIYLMVELYARNGNPYTAARLLDDAMQKQQVPATLDYQEKLFSYWMMAKERRLAIAALQKTIIIKPEIERYLQLAQLQMDEQQWPAMKETLSAACQGPLPDHHVAHANVLLGISELKLGNANLARRAFINAMTVSADASANVAADYLRYMEAEPPSEAELSTLEGICLPAWAHTRAVSLAAPSPSLKEKAGKALKYTVKTSARQKLVTATFSIAVAEMEQKLRPLAMQMATHIVKHGGHIDGYMHFIFTEPVTPGAEVIRFQMAFPVRKQPQLPGRYKMVDDAGYKSASFVFSGPPQQLPVYWQKLYESVLADGLQPSGSARQIVLEAQAGRDQITMELQLGLQ